MHVSILPEDNAVYVDGVYRQVVLPEMDATIHAIQYNDVYGIIDVEWKHNTHGQKPPNAVLRNEGVMAPSFAAVETLINACLTAWEDAAPEPEGE